MKLPPSTGFQLQRWDEEALAGWARLTEGLVNMRQGLARGDAFRKEAALLQRLAQQGASPRGRLHRRVTARVLTFLWLEDREYRKRVLRASLLTDLANQQLPSLGLISLQNLIALYFKEFDRLDEVESGLREFLETLLERQLARRAEAQQARGRTLPRQLATLHDLGGRLLREEGPRWLVARVRITNTDLDRWLSENEMEGLGQGRYGDLYRIHYYLETLKQLPVGADHELFCELRKPEVSRAPYEGRRLGHAALEQLIDRSSEDPGEAWRNFILELAGDPRISSRAPSYREWWMPLGEGRIEKVRSWLSRVDLRLFLHAVEHYGKERNDAELERMFPARKHFMEGLEKQGLIRSTRLMLGSRAEEGVTRILGDRLKTHFIQLPGLSDQAVIYIDCGEFFLIEGSHNFRLWIYLAPPSSLLTSYDHALVTRSDLIERIPRDYDQQFGRDAPRTSITHYPPLAWQQKAFEFLAQNGIELDIEQMLTRKDYRDYLSRFGLPEVRPSRTRVTETSDPGGRRLPGYI